MCDAVNFHYSDEQGLVSDQQREISVNVVCISVCMHEEICDSQFSSIHRVYNESIVANSWLLVLITTNLYRTTS